MPFQERESNSDLEHEDRRKELPAEYTRTEGSMIPMMTMGDDEMMVAHQLMVPRSEVRRPAPRKEEDAYP